MFPIWRERRKHFYVIKKEMAGVWNLLRSLGCSLVEMHEQAESKQRGKGAKHVHYIVLKSVIWTAIKNAFECDQNYVHSLACIAQKNTFGNQDCFFLIIQMPQAGHLGIKLILLKCQNISFCFQAYACHSVLPCLTL